MASPTVHQQDTVAVMASGLLQGTVEQEVLRTLLLHLLEIMNRYVKVDSSSFETRFEFNRALHNESAMMHD
jgi:septum formation topological specificity factor MinE